MGVYGFTTFHHTIHLRRSGPAPLKRQPARQQQRPRAPRSGVAIRTPFGKEGGPGNSWNWRLTLWLFNIAIENGHL